jgi:hypothetical protein
MDQSNYGTFDNQIYHFEVSKNTITKCTVSIGIFKQKIIFFLVLGMIPFECGLHSVPVVHIFTESIGIRTLLSLSLSFVLSLSLSLSLTTCVGYLILISNCVYSTIYSPHIPGVFASTSGDHTLKVWSLSGRDLLINSSQSDFFLLISKFQESTICHSSFCFYV